MVSKKLSAAVAAAAASRRPQPTEGDLAHLRGRLAVGRELEMEIAELQERATEKSVLLSDLRTRELPDLYEKLGIDSLGLDRSGNLPAYDTKLKPYYSANLPKDRLGEALALLSEMKASDLSKTRVEIQFGRGEEKTLVKLRAFLRREGIPADEKTGVHSSTLTAWIRERFQGNRPLSPSQLATLGATVGKVVEMKRRKEG